MYSLSNSMPTVNINDLILLQIWYLLKRKRSSHISAVHFMNNSMSKPPFGLLWGCSPIPCHQDCPVTSCGLLERAFSFDPVPLRLPWRPLAFLARQTSSGMEAQAFWICFWICWMQSCWFQLSSPKKSSTSGLPLLSAKFFFSFTLLPICFGNDMCRLGVLGLRSAYTRFVLFRVQEL